MTLYEKEPEFYEFSNYRLKPSARRLVEKGNESVVPLSPKSFELLLLLVRNSGRIVTKEMIFEQIWDARIVEENNLTVRISELRKAFDEKRGENKFIETVSRSGYCFIAEVREVWNTRDDLTNNRELHSLAVLPFVNESDDPNLEYLSDGITENIINSLSQLHQIRTISRNTVFRYKGTEIDYHYIGQELDVQIILHGRLYEMENNLIVSVELVNVQDNSQIWGDRYSNQLTDLFKLEREITKKVSANLKLKFTAEEAHPYKRYTQNWEAYILYLKGRYFWNKRSLNGFNSAIKYFEQAIEKDSTYALAFSGLADCYIILIDFGFRSPKENFPKAEAAAMKALELDDSLAEAYASLGRIKFLNRNWSESEKAFKRSIELNSNYAEARYWYASYLSAMKRFDEAFFELDKAQRIDPLSLAVNKAICKTLYLSRRYNEAIQKCLEALEIDAGYEHTRGILGLAYLGRRMYEQAILEFEKVIKLSPDESEFSGDDGQSLRRFQEKVFSQEAHPESIGILGYIYALAGKRKRALELLEGLKNLSKQRYVEPHSIAFIYTGLGDKNRAFEWLEKLFVDEQSTTLIFLNVWSIFDDLRSDPRFQNLLRRAGFYS